MLSSSERKSKGLIIIGIAIMAKNLQLFTKIAGHAILIYLTKRIPPMSLPD
jgi:hypothetical protein